jgi:hypothetical protein
LSQYGRSFSMKSSTAGPAMTSNMIFLGVLSFLQNSSME